jgi:mRNA-degrading endonuclease toxin of MazEF toxin-antitoxin module
MVKRFLEWIGLKEKLHNAERRPPLVSEREVWWISFGENVGSEINGKSELFSRPGLVLKKLSRSFYLVVPTTTQKREGSWYSPIFYNGETYYLCLHQIRTIDYRRLSSRVGEINESDFMLAKKAFMKLYCNVPHLVDEAAAMPNVPKILANEPT